jgi:hypothetical protein
MLKSITVTNKVAITLGKNRNHMTAHIPEGMRGKTLKNIYNKNAARFTLAHQVLAFNEMPRPCK